jgi:hypothetical protein
MSLISLLRTLAVGHRKTGLFSFLACRDNNRSKIELEKARSAATAEIIDHLPCGAIFRESTADGWREIWVPQTPLPLLVAPADNCAPMQGEEAAEIQAIEHNSTLGGLCVS